MDFLVNDLSFHGQFPDVASFRDAIGRVMRIRQIARRFGRSLLCHRNIAHAAVTRAMIMPQAVQQLPPDERRVLLQWLTQHGPFWEDARNHSSNDWLESDGEVVTDTAVGEAAWCCLNGIERRLVSLTPSDWEFSPVAVDLVLDTTDRSRIDISNHWDPADVETVLHAAPLPLDSWRQLEGLATTRYTQLTFAVDAFKPLDGHPFVSGAAHRLVSIFETLNRFKVCFDSDGRRTAEGHEIYQNFFTGKKGEGGRGALFSDSSEQEKFDFKSDLTFAHPGDMTTTLFCPWHGKVQTPQLRVHFSWPVTAEDPLYIVYVGPKRTKR